MVDKHCCTACKLGSRLVLFWQTRPVAGIYAESSHREESNSFGDFYVFKQISILHAVSKLGSYVFDRVHDPCQLCGRCIPFWALSLSLCLGCSLFHVAQAQPDHWETMKEWVHQQLETCLYRIIVNKGAYSTRWKVFRTDMEGSISSVTLLRMSIMWVRQWTINSCTSWNLKHCRRAFCSNKRCTISTKLYREPQVTVKFQLANWSGQLEWSGGKKWGK